MSESALLQALKALKASMSPPVPKVKSTTGSAERGDQKLSWRYAGPLAQLKMEFESESKIEGIEGSTHTVTKASGWVTMPRQAVLTAVALFNRLGVPKAEVEDFQAFDFKDPDLKITVSNEQYLAEEQEAAAQVEEKLKAAEVAAAPQNTVH